ncbi:MAG TPA: methyltransferase domain-containing protein [Actinomycetota bacterium]|nr:methyltransferase domain-containing protein [Actinomycetota bacterium]
MDDALYVQHDLLEEDHWWFVGRRRIVLSVLRSFLPQVAGDRQLLDVGCGTGGMLKALRSFGDVTGMDTSPFAIDRARERSGCPVEWGVLPEPTPFEPESFDVVTALDVVEHVDDDEGALRTIHRVLRPGGLFVCTVPAFRFLWSGHDEVNHHRRRYRRSELLQKLQDGGFGIRKATYFNFLLFAPIALVRIGGRVSGRKGSDFEVPSRGINGVLAWIFGAERHLLRVTSLPFGVSLLVVCEKVPHSAS